MGCDERGSLVGTTPHIVPPARRTSHGIGVRLTPPDRARVPVNRHHRQAVTAR